MATLGCESNLVRRDTVGIRGNGIKSHLPVASTSATTAVRSRVGNPATRFQSFGPEGRRNNTMTETYYKVLNEDGSCFHGGIGTWHLPTANKPGKWMPRIEGSLELRKNGYHILRTDQLVLWLGPAIFTVEPKGEIVHDTEKSVCKQARLLTRLTAWNDRTARLFGADCAEHVLTIYQRLYPGDTRPEQAIKAIRDYANGTITADELAALARTADELAALTAWTLDAPFPAAWTAARAAAWASARTSDAASAQAAATKERNWQTELLLRYLQPGGAEKREEI